MSQVAAAGFHFERFFDTSGDLLFILDPKARFLRINRALCDVLGYPEDTLREQAFFDIIHFDDLGEVRSEVAPVLERGGAVTVSFRVRRRDQSLRALAFTLRSIPEDAAVYGVGRDQGVASLWEDRLLRSEIVLQKLQSSARVGGWTVDCRTMEAFWTEETYRIHEVPFDYKPNVEEGIKFYAPESVPLITAAVERCMQGEPYDLQLQIITAKGRRVWVRAAGSPLWEDGKVVQLFGSFQDIDEMKRRELELSDQLAIIEQQKESIQAMSAPIIQVWDDVLALPVVGTLDAARAEDITERLLRAVVRTRSSHAILDLTGVEDVDAATADHLVRIIRAIQLLGAKSIVTGIRPRVAQMLTSMDGALQGATTLSSLSDALKACMRASAERARP